MVMTMNRVEAGLDDVCRNGHVNPRRGKPDRSHPTGRCRECASNSQRRYRVGRAKRRRLLSAEPLLEMLAARARLYADPTRNVSGYGILAQQYAARFGGTAENVQRSLWRMRARISSVTEDNADQWCVLLGKHLSELWPDWDQE